ncbi:non-ribosomal peptide synthetase, partial [Bacillus sp. ISL-53]|nr:non-ribosomal peptide synthetase [Bacillus sp. ISL-53]
MKEPIYYPITHPQRRIWYTEMLHSSKSIYNVGFTIKIDQKIDYSLLNQAINRVIKENDSLRIRLKQKYDHEPIQYFAEFKEELLDFSDLSTAKDSKIDEWMTQKLEEPFQFYDTALYYFNIIKIRDEESIIFFKLHHIITDGLSMHILVRDIIDHYVNLSTGIEKCVPKGSYVQFIESEEKYLNSSSFKDDEAFWLDEFQTIPSTTGLKTFNPYMTSTKSSREVFNVSNELRDKIKEFSQKNKFSLFTIFVSALQLSLHRWTSSKDIVLGTAYGNFTGKDDKEITGMMVSTLPLRMNIEAEEEVLDFIARLDRKKRKIIKHKRYPLNILYEKIKKEEMNFDRFFRVSMDYRYEELSHQLKHELTWLPNNHEDNELYLNIVERPNMGDLVFLVDYREELFSKEEISHFINSMFILLENLLKNPNQKTRELNMLSKEEQQLLFVDFNKSNLPLPVLDCFAHQVIEEQVEKRPDAIAAI